MSEVPAQEGPEWSDVEGLLGIAPDDVDVINDAADMDSADLWIVETEIARLVLDRYARRITSYPTDGQPRGLHDRRSRAWTRRDDPPIVGEDWAWTEVVEAAPTDPWGDQVKHPVGRVIAVRGVDL